MIAWGISSEWADWEWLEWFEKDITTPTYALIHKGNKYKAAKQWELAERCYKEAIERARKGDDRDPHAEGVALVYLAESYRAQGKVEKAINSYKQAIDIFRRMGSLHNQGTTSRILGMIYQSRQQWSQSLACYQDALNLFTKLRLEHKQRGNRQKAIQYTSWCQEICVRINEVMTSYQPELEAQPSQMPSRPASQQRLTQQEIKFLPILTSAIAAGEVIPADDNIEGYLCTDRVFINDIEYQIINLTDGSATVKFIPDYQYRVVPVEGNSMNDAPVKIEEGDYIVLRKPMLISLVPQEGQIVAAVIPGEGRKATLKRYHQKGNVIELRPESTDPKNPIYRFEIKRGRMPVDIVGVAVAVLKRKKQNP